MDQRENFNNLTLRFWFESSHLNEQWKQGIDRVESPRNHSSFRKLLNLSETERRKQSIWKKAAPSAI